MLHSDWSLNDTIAAISSAPGPAARGVIRLSGPESYSIIAGFLARDKTDSYDCKTNHWRDVEIQISPELTCPARLLAFYSPHSFTGEDCIEIHLPGSPALLKLVLKKLINAGTRPANPGEFTARAFFNGRIDLSQAEAVNEMISARSDAQLLASKRLLDGELHKRCLVLRDGIIELLALVELTLDFADQDIPPVSPDEMQRLLNSVVTQVENLLTQAPRWEQLHHLPRVVFAGRPNAGKSTLINALSGVTRSIVSHISGTTRDLLTVPMPLDHGECLLIDTAGLEDESCIKTINDNMLSVNAQMQELAQKAIAEADLVVWVVDGTRPEETWQPNRPGLVAVNKVDQMADAQPGEGVWHGHKAIYISALKGDGLADMKAKINTCLQAGIIEADGPALTTRQHGALKECQETLKRADNLLKQADFEGELFAIEVREALEKLGLITGETAKNGLLHHIFERFCIGK